MLRNVPIIAKLRDYNAKTLFLFFLCFAYLFLGFPDGTQDLAIGFLHSWHMAHDIHIINHSVPGRETSLSPQYFGLEPVSSPASDIVPFLPRCQGLASTPEHLLIFSDASVTT